MGSTSFVDCVFSFEPPTPPTFFRVRKFLAFLRLRRTILYVSHTMRYDCILALCFLPRKRSCDVPICVGKKGRCAFVYRETVLLSCGGMHVLTDESL